MDSENIAPADAASDTSSYAVPQIRPAGRQTFAMVDLDAVRSNVQAVAGSLSPDTALAAVIKADAYGHGAVRTAEAALAGGAAMLAVAMAEEAVPLRQAGIRVPVLVIGPSNREQVALGVELGLDLCVFAPEHLRNAEVVAAQTGRNVRVHIKADTGMHRIGTGSMAELNELLDTLQTCPHLELAGMFTHFAEADRCAVPSKTEKPHAGFLESVRQVQLRGWRPRLHVSNSAATLNYPAMDHDIVRCGIALYGYPPLKEQSTRHVRLHPAMQVWAEISRLQDLPAGAPVGYGASFRTQRPTRVATVQIGYGDGYDRLLSNRGSMIVLSPCGPRYAPVVGRVCMDMTMIDVTGIPGLRTGDLALVMGRAGTLHMDAEDIAALCGTISYEILLGFSSRVPRLYTGESSEAGCG